MKHRARSVILLAFVMAVLPPEAAARYQPSSGMDFFSRQQEIQAGQQAAAQIPRQMPVLPDSDPISRYIQRLGSELASHAPGERWPYSFHVANVKAINAFALPGGPVFVNMGTIQAADNEAQLAGVLSHEISHVVQRHATRAATKQLMAQAPLTVLGGLLAEAWVGSLRATGFHSEPVRIFCVIPASLNLKLTWLAPTSCTTLAMIRGRWPYFSRSYRRRAGRALRNF